MPTNIDIQADTTLRYMAQATNYDIGVPWAGGTDHLTGFETKAAQCQILLRCDFSGDIPALDDISAATLNLYVVWGQSSGLLPPDYTWKCDRIRRVWVEDEATDLIYTTGNNWGTAGAENVATDRGAPQDLQVGPAGGDIPCWWTFNVLAHVLDARLNHSDIFNAIIDPGFILIEEGYLYLCIEDRLNEDGHTPYLSITHEGAPPAGAPRNQGHIFCSRLGLPSLPDGWLRRRGLLVPVGA